MEFYAVLDNNEIDAQGKDTDVLAVESDTEWTKVCIREPQDVPAGDYVFAVSLQATLSATNNSLLWRVNGSVELGEEELKVDRERPLVRHTYFFNLSWDGGLFNVDIEMARANTSFAVMCDFAEMVLTRRS